MQNMELIALVELGLRFIEGDDAPERIGGVDHAVVLVFHTDVERSVIGKAIGKQRIGARAACSGISFGNSNCLLPDRTSVGYLEDLCLRIEKLVQVREINMGPDAVGPEVMNRIKRSEIDLLRDRFP